MSECSTAHEVRFGPTCPECGHLWRQHDPEDGLCDSHAEVGLGQCPCTGRQAVALLSRHFLTIGQASGYVIRRASGALVGPFETSVVAQAYMVDGDELLVMNEHGNVIDYGPQFGEDTA